MRREARRVRVGALLLLAAVAVVVYGADFGSKYLVSQNLELGDTVPVLGEVLQLHYVTNSGAAFSLASGFTWVLSLVAAGVIVFIVVFAPRIRSLGWATMFGLVLGGALGNVTDRVFRGESFGTGEVIDFIQVWGFPAIFNVADIGVVAAMCLFVLLSLRGVGLDGTRTPVVEPTTSEPAEKA
ncbi:MAG: signal peptidase II [Microbacteriaceae bacterium]|nr:signal peptidase II [Microbacteriaceae bacterium]